MGKEILGLVDQIPVSVLMEGEKENIPISKMGQLFTADWHQRLALAGRVFTMPLGTITGEGSYSALTGNAKANGTSVDNDQPEIIIAIDTGWLIPIEIDIGISATDLDAYNDYLNVLFIADRSQTVAAGESGNIITAINLLDGGDAFSGRCYDTISSDITNPVCSDVLGFRYWEITQLAAEVLAHVPATFNFYKKFDIPRFLAGPCSIIGFVNGIVAPTYMGSVTFAHVPTSWIPLS